MRKSDHRKMYLLLLCLLLPLVINVALADHGPKPSITVNVKNGPEAYYIGLLHNTEAGDRWLTSLRESPEVTKNEALKKLVDYEDYNWKLHIPPVGDSYFLSTATGSYLFDYSVPSFFRVILVEFDGTVHVSNPIEKKGYNAVFDYDVTTGDITEDYTESNRHYAINALLCYFITLFFEGILLLLFDFGQKKNWLHFLFINTLTQVLLNGFLVYSDWHGASTLDLLSLFLCLELAIFVIEAGYYALFLRTQTGDKKPSKSVKYAIAANLTSMVCGFIITLFL